MWIFVIVASHPYTNNYVISADESQEHLKSVKLSRCLHINLMDRKVYVKLIYQEHSKPLSTLTSNIFKCVIFRVAIQSHIRVFQVY